LRGVEESLIAIKLVIQRSTFLLLLGVNNNVEFVWRLLQIKISYPTLKNLPSKHFPLAAG